MTVGEIMGYAAAGITGLLVVMRLVDTYFAEREKGAKAGAAQMSLAQLAVFHPTAERYRTATFEEIIGEIHARVTQIHEIVLSEDRERREEERRKLTADLAELEEWRRRDRDGA